MKGVIKRQIILLIMLAIIFREARWVIIPVANCVITVTMMLGLLGFLDWRMTVISANFVAVLLVVSLAISIHLVVRYRELESLNPNEEIMEFIVLTNLPETVKICILEKTLIIQGRILRAS